MKEKGKFFKQMSEVGRWTSFDGIRGVEFPKKCF